MLLAAEYQQRFDDALVSGEHGRVHFRQLSADAAQASHVSEVRALGGAARAAFPDGSIKLSSLRREARRGNLTIWRIANKDMTTLAEIRSMVEKCRVPPSLRASGSGLREAREQPPGSSSTPDVAGFVGMFEKMVVEIYGKLDPAYQRNVANAFRSSMRGARLNDKRLKVQ